MSILNHFLNLYKVKKNPITFARNIGVRVGEECRFLGTTPSTFGSEPFLIEIGNHVTITGGVRFVTHDGGVWVFRKESPNIDVFGPIRVGNNVFIGLNAIIMPNVQIGNNVVIAAGSIVTKNVPSDSVVAGVPAKVINSLETYKNNVEKKAMHIRNLEISKKKQILLKTYSKKD